MFRQLRQHLAWLFELETSRIKQSSHLIDDLDADSIDFLDLALIFQDEFDVRVDPDDILDLFARLGRFILDRQAITTENLSETDFIEMASKLTVGSLVDFIISETGEGKSPIRDRGR